MPINFTQFLRSGLTVVLLVMGTISGSAQSAYTIPQGYVKVFLPATNASQTTTTYVSLPLLNAPVYSSVVSFLTANSVTVDGTPWTTNQFAVVGSPYFLKVVSGQQAGRLLLITANTGETLTVDTTDHSSQTTALNASGFALQAGDKFQVVAGDTLSSILGDGSVGSPLVLVGGANTFTADTISIYNTSLNRSDIYYFNTTRNAWSLSNTTDNQNNLVVYPDMVLGITRRPNRPALDFLVSGSVPEIAPLTKIVGQSAPTYGSPRFPVDLALSAINFNGWTKSNSLFTADTLSVWNATLARWDVYYQLTNGQWRKSGDTVTDQSSFVIAAGSEITILKRSAVSGAGSFLSITIPYTLNQ